MARGDCWGLKGASNDTIHCLLYDGCANSQRAWDTFASRHSCSVEIAPFLPDGSTQEGHGKQDLEQVGSVLPRKSTGLGMI